MKINLLFCIIGYRFGNKSLSYFFCKEGDELKRILHNIYIEVRVIIAFIVVIYLDNTRILHKLKLTSFAGSVSTTDLVNRIFLFCEAYSGKTMYPYQAQFSKRIIRSVLENDGAELTALFSRQSGKTETVAITVGGLMIILPQLANMPMFLNDARLQTFKDGLWVGIFAPSQRQAQTTYLRMKNRLQCKEAIAILSDPDFRLEFTTSNGQTVALSNGSFCTAISASDNSNIEGESLKFIICEECQDISNFKIRKSIHPMGAAYNATICKIGTATTYKGNFYEAIQRNKKEFEDGKLKVRNHFEYDYKVVMKYNPKYEKYIEREKRSLGETSDEFRMSYNLEWIISRGMFIDLDEFEKMCGDEYLERVPQDKKAVHVGGIDVGGGSSKDKKRADSTTVTIVEVDWENPVVMEVVTDEETQEDIVYQRYNTYLKDWLELSPDIADNYEEQYQLIMEYLKNFRLARLVVDATREASLGQRIRANINCEVILFTFSSKSKSELYKHLQSEIKTGRARFPKGPETVKTVEYQKFIKQMSDLEKSYSGSYLVVAHPDVRNAHDDFPDSWALAVWGAKDSGYVDMTETYDRSKVLNPPKKSRNNPLFKSRNHYTARRR